VPDLVVVSPATRARQTWEGAQAVLGVSVEVLIDDRIYDNDVDSLLAVIRDTPEHVRTLGLVGHNPSFELLAHELDDRVGDDALRSALMTGS
jgi:phosphohistidine phosphatase